jgi:hypothetical protein
MINLTPREYPAKTVNPEKNAERTRKPKFASRRLSEGYPLMRLRRNGLILNLEKVCDLKKFQVFVCIFWTESYNSSVQ